jgi:hypothetical protein
MVVDNDVYCNSIVAGLKLSLSCSSSSPEAKRDKKKKSKKHKKDRYCSISYFVCEVRDHQYIFLLRNTHCSNSRYLNWCHNLEFLMELPHKFFCFKQNNRKGF